MLKRLKLVVFLLMYVGCAAHAFAADTPRPEAPSYLAIEGEAVSAIEWQLAKHQYIAAKMPLAVVYPRPDSETSAWARHRKAYPGLEYRVPIAVQGGAYPFRYEIVRGPRGMSIGARHWEKNYGVLNWTPSREGGPFDVQVRITDQGGAAVDVTFAVSATRQGFVFLDPSAPSSGDGSISAPLKSFADIHRNSADDRTFAGAILYLRDGLHQLSGPAGNNNNFRIDDDNKPLVWLGYPGEFPIVDASTSQVIMTGSSSGRDVFMQGFRMSRSRTDVDNSRFFFFGASAGERATFFEVEFDHLVRGIRGDDNPGAIVMFRGDSHREYLVVHSCGIDEYAAPLVGSIYATRYAVIEGNRLGSSASETDNQGIFAKAANDYWSIRRNVSVERVFREGAVQNMMGSSGYGPQRIEIAYNLLRSPVSSNSAHSLRVNWSNGARGDNKVWVYRNTIIGPISGLDGEYTAVFENNVILSDQNPVLLADGVNRIIVDSDNVTRRRSDVARMLGDGYELKGQHRDELFGSYGHELWR